VTSAKVIPLRAGLAPSPSGGEPNAAVVDRLAELLEMARAGEVVGIAYATLHPGDLSIYDTRGRTTRGLLGALTLLQFDMCKADAAE
jgi:hypothetical protein